MLKYEIIIFWSDEDDVFVTFAPELIGCMAHGDTREEALQNIQEAMALWVDVARETGKAVPEPNRVRVDFWPDYAGKPAATLEAAG